MLDFMSLLANNKKNDAYNNVKHGQAKMGSKILPISFGVDRSSINKTSNCMKNIPSCMSASCKFSHTQLIFFVKPVVEILVDIS